MSGGHGGGGANWKPLLEIIAVILGIWILWFFTGGPERAAQQGDMPFLNPPNPVSNGQIYNTNGGTTNPQ